MRKAQIIAGFTLLTCAAAGRADVLSTAAALWKFDAATSGSVTAAQITDASGNGHNATSLTNSGELSWTTVPAVGPGGGPAVDPGGAGLQFTPIRTAGDSTTTDTVASTGFAVSNFAVTGNATLLTRFYWGGYVSDDADAQMCWIYNNALGSNGAGWMFGIRSSKLTFYMNGTGLLGAYDSPLTLTAGKWYDAGAVLRADGTLELYLIPEGGSLQTISVARNAPTTAGANTYVGSESLGTGNSNQRKGFLGTLDYIGVWDSELTDAEVRSVMIPEPATMLPMLLTGLALVRRR